MQAEAVQKLKQIASEAKMHAICLVPGRNLQYMTGVKFHLLERPFMVFIAVEGEAVAILPALEAQQFIDTGFEGQVFPWQDADGYDHAFRAGLATLNLQGTLGVEGLTMRFRESQLIQHYLPEVTMLDADHALVALRIQKTAEEIEYHRQAIKISETALEQLLSEIRIGMTEHDIAQRLSQLQQVHGGAGDAFPPTVLVGARSALPHGEPGSTPLKDGDTMLIDFGTRYNGYVSDITRTFFVGEPSQQMRAIYAAVLAANVAGRAAARPGISGEALDRVTTQVLHDHGHSEYVKHRTGHGIGLDIHEHPNISVENNDPLAIGMAFTIEPGLYASGIGGVRIEDNMVITENGAESLTTFPRELQVLALS